jgi:sugar phosphate isomerase/epimerase
MRTDKGRLSVAGRPSRREVLGAAFGVGVLAGRREVSADQQAPASGLVRLGGPAFLGGDGPTPGAGGGLDPARAARTMRELSFRATLCPDVDVNDAAALRAIERAYPAEEIVIAEVGAFGFNMMARDAAERKTALDAMCQKLTIADEVGARCAVNIAGFRGVDAQNRQHPDNLNQVGFDLTVENVRYILDTVKPRRAKFAIETMAWIIPDGPDRYLELLKAVDRPMFGAHFDPVNMISSPARFFGNADFLRDCFTKVGRFIVSCHGKDTILRGGLTVHIDEGRPGTGSLDWKTYLRGVAALPQQPPIVLEHLPNRAEYLLARDYVFAEGQQAGVRFS